MRWARFDHGGTPTYGVVEGDIVIPVRFKGGATDVLTLPLPRRVYALRKLSPAVIQEIDRLALVLHRERLRGLSG